MQPCSYHTSAIFNCLQPVDLFIVYDNIKYTKKGWINRNRMLLNGSDCMFFPSSEEGI